MLLAEGSRADLLENGSCIFPNAWSPPIRAAVSVSSTSSWAEASRAHVQALGEGSGHQTFASRAVLGSNTVRPETDSEVSRAERSSSNQVKMIETTGKIVNFRTNNSSENHYELIRMAVFCF